MATQTRRRSPGSASGASSLEGGLERLIEPALLARRRLPSAWPWSSPWRWWRSRCSAPCAPSGRAAWSCRGRRSRCASCPRWWRSWRRTWRRAPVPPPSSSGYVDLQLDAGEALLTGWPAVDWGAFGLAYALAVWPYAGAGGALAGAVAFCFVSCGGGFSRGEETKRNELRLQDAGELAAEAERPVAWVVPNAVGRGVLSLLSAPPGLGKGWWTWGLLRAVQDGGTFFGLRVRRPVRVSWLRPPRPAAQGALVHRGGGELHAHGAPVRDPARPGGGAPARPGARLGLAGAGAAGAARGGAPGLRRRDLRHRSAPGAPRPRRARRRRTT